MEGINKELTTTGKIIFFIFIKEFLYVNRFRGKILYYDHHLCHITSSLATYPINNSYLLSLDGGGDNLNWSFYSYFNFKLKLLENSKSFYQNKKVNIIKQVKDRNDSRKKLLYLDELGKEFFNFLYFS